MSDSSENHLEQLKSHFESSILPKWKEFQADLGTFLLEAQSNLSGPYYRALSLWLKEDHGISKSIQEVAVRIAKGEMTQEQAELIPPSVAKNIATHNIPEPDKEYKIYSPNAGGVIKKKFRDFTKEEKKVNLTNHGVRMETQSTKEQQPFVTARASSFRVEGDVLVISVNSIRKDIHLKITAELAREVEAVAGVCQ